MTLFERNLAVLSRTDPTLALQLQQTAPRRDIVGLKSAGGEIVPALRGKPGERPRAYHSTVDPRREGARFRRLYPGQGYFIFLGLGGGYQTGGFLAAKSAQVQRIIIIDHDPGFLRTVMTMLDLSQLFSDPRLRMLVGQTPGEIRAFLAQDYLPLRDGDLQTIPLRISFQTEKPYFEAVLQACREAAQLAADDTAVQARFGRRWFLNTVANLAAGGVFPLPRTRTAKAVVLAAGPSLDTQLPGLDSLRRGGLVIATDTALPSLLATHIKPDLVVSLDCQHVSYHHFLSGLPADIPLWLDLASPPLLSRLARQKFFFAGGHPFSRYLTAHYRHFPWLDTSGGNVTQTAVSLARYLGAEEIFVLGADFSYPAGKAYARGTYLYPYYRSRENRYRPLESLFFSFLRQGGPLTRGPGGYSTPLLDAYRQRLTAALKSMGGLLSTTADSSRVLRIRLPRSAEPPAVPPAPGSGRNWREFLQSYSDSLRALPLARYPLRDYLRGLNASQQDLWTTQLPAAAAIARAQPGLNGPALLESTRGWALEVMQRSLNR